MKKFAFIILSALALTSCWTSIWTVAPTDEVVVPVQTVYSTTVTTPTPKTKTVTTVTVTSYNTDLSFYLDLNAVAAAFAEARNVAEFEQLLNSSRYMINNLDLNRDGWIDYLRVIETHRGTYHTFLIQACLAPAVFQDVATLVAEHRPSVLYVEVIGDRWLYGPNYIVRPVFIKRPPLWDVFGRPSYAAWASPYYYNYWPSYYQKPKPIYLNHYQAYVKTYMTNHHYCHQCEFPSQPFYNGYTQMTQPHSHNDFAAQHPDNSFERRVTQNLSSGGVTVRNAGELRTETQRETARTNNATTTTSGSSPRTSTTTSTGGRTATPTASTSMTSTTTSGRTGSTSTSAQKPSSTTTTATTTTSGRTSTTTSGATTRQPSTTVESRVNKSGTTRTTIKSTDESGRTTTVRRESTDNRTSTSSGASSRTSSSSTSSTSGRTSNNERSGSTRR